jgi:protein-arginine kinase activator protein McsA
MENHFNLLMQSGFKALDVNKIPWPKEFTLQNKLSLLNKMLEYFTSTEEYKKCIVISKKIKSLNRKRPVKSAEKSM